MNAEAEGDRHRAGPPPTACEALEPRLLLSTIPLYFDGDIDLDTGTGTGPDGVVRVLGDGADDYSGASVSSAGDVNGDGYGDFLIGAYQADPAGGDRAGETYLVFGHDGVLSPWSDIDFGAEVPSTTAIRILGDDSVNWSGYSVSSAGDVNNDTYDDFLIGAPYADPEDRLDAGETYLVFGHGGAWSDIDFNLAVPSTTAIRILGDDANDHSGYSVSSAGNVNGDLFDDFLIGAYGADPAGGANAGETYLVFGHGGEWSDINLNTVTGTGPEGVVRILGDDANDLSGISVSSAGDVNNDGHDDILIGAYWAEGAEGEDALNAGETYLVFGHVGEWLDIDFSVTVAPTTAIRILGDDTYDWSGWSVSSAGNVNGDNYDDFLIGAYGADQAGGDGEGETYLVFGHGEAWSDIDFNGTVPSTTAIRILGDDADDSSGFSVSSAGDVNDDGYGDLLIGATGADPAGGANAGETYLVFGHAGDWSDIDLDTGTGTGPGGVLRILGDDAGDYSGSSVSSAGDVNNDGYDDFLIGAYGADQADQTEAGETYLVFGRSSEVPELPDLSGRVYEDVNYNGVDDGVSDEPGIAGVRVSLVGAENRTAVTDSNGAYLFQDVLPGSYSISAEQPAGWVDGDEQVGTLGGVVGDDVISEIDVLAGGPDGTGYSFGELAPSMIEGLVWEDANGNGEVDFGEKGISGVTLNLTGTDDRGNAVSVSAVTGGKGLYELAGLRPGTYDLSEVQPIGFDDGTDSAGTVNGLPSGTALNPGDEIAGIILPGPGSVGINYNFGEAPSSSTVSADQVATVAFWHNKFGQALILALNGGSTSTQLGDWLAVTFPNLYGVNAGNDLTGKDNAEVAAFYQSLFALNIQTTPGGPAKLEAEVLSVALATYVTNSTLAGDVATDYGFAVSEDGLAVELFNVGVCGDAFDVEDHSLVTILDLLLATNDNTVNGILYDLDGDGIIDQVDELDLRYLADDVYAAICETK